MSDVEQFIPLKTQWFHILVSLVGGEQHGYGIMQEGATVARDLIWVDQANDRRGID